MPNFYTKFTTDIYCSWLVQSLWFFSPRFFFFFNEICECECDNDIETHIFILKIEKLEEKKRHRIRTSQFFFDKWQIVLISLLTVDLLLWLLLVVSHRTDAVLLMCKLGSWRHTTIPAAEFWNSSCMYKITVARILTCMTNRQL